MAMTALVGVQFHARVAAKKSSSVVMNMVMLTAIP